MTSPTLTPWPHSQPPSQEELEAALRRQGLHPRWWANYYPIQVKQKDRVGRPDIDSFETAMRRDRRTRGYFIGFGFSHDATKEIRRVAREEGLDIRPITVKQLLDYERVVT